MNNVRKFILSTGEMSAVRIPPYAFTEALSRYDRDVREKADVSFRFVEGKSFKDNVILVVKRQLPKNLVAKNLVAVLLTTLWLVALSLLFFDFAFIVDAFIGAVIVLLFKNIVLIKFRNRFDYFRLKRVFKKVWDRLPAASLESPFARQVAVEVFTNKYGAQAALLIAKIAEGSELPLKAVVEASLVI